MASPPIHPRGAFILYSLTANMNITTDQPFIKRFDFTQWTAMQIRALNASISLTNAVGGVYSQIAKGGFTFVPASTAYNGLISNAVGISLGTTANALGINTVTPILALTTPQGAAATCDFYILGIPLS